MAGATIGIRIDDHQMRDLIGKVVKRTGSPQPALAIIGETVRGSVKRNFERSGRPRGWKKLSGVTLQRKKGGKILIGQGEYGGLLESIHAEVKNDRVLVGTDKVYGAVHQFGAKKGSFGTTAAQVKAHERRNSKGNKQKVKAHTRRMKLPWGDIPARPYLMLQPEDYVEITALLADYITGDEA